METFRSPLQPNDYFEQQTAGNKRIIFPLIIHIKYACLIKTTTKKNAKKKVFDKLKEDLG